MNRTTRQIIRPLACTAAVPMLQRVRVRTQVEMGLEPTREGQLRVLEAGEIARRLKRLMNLSK